MPELVARAPARIDFGGGWTDVPPYSEERGGCVCSAAISLHAVATVRDIESNDTRPRDEDGLAGAALRRSGVPGVSLDIQSGYPVGAGLGGSSAASVASLGALAAWRGIETSPTELAEESRRLEVEDLGIAGGRQDHYAAAYGGLLGLHFGGDTQVESLDLTTDLGNALAARCVLAYTGQSRISGETITAVTGAYEARDRRVLDALDRLRELATQMIDALRRNDIDALGGLVGEHWVHQRSLHPGIPTPLIDQLLEDATRAGALGGKAMGASGGGCVLAIAPADGVEPVRQAMGRLATLLPFHIAPHGFHVVDPADPITGSLRPWTS